MSGVYANDRRIVEHLMWPLLVESYAVSQEECQETPEEKASVARIVSGARAYGAALLEPLEPRRQDKLMRRALRDIREASAELDGKHGGTVGVALYYAIEDLLASDMLWIEEGSPLGDALLEVLESLRGHFDNPKVDKAGRKNGRRLLGRLLAMGYYSGHKLRDE